MERIATILLLVASAAGLYYGYVDSVENQESESKTSRFIIPHDTDANTASIEVSLDGSGSYDENGDPIKYKWTVDPSSTDLSSNDEEVTSFTAETGEYSFTLTITDSYGAKTSVEHTVVVENEPNDDPSASIIAILGSEEEPEPVVEIEIVADSTAVDSLTAIMTEAEASDSTSTVE